MPKTIESASIRPPRLRPDLDFTIIERDSYRYGGSASTNVSITNRTTLGLSYSHTQTAFDDRSADMQIRGAGANLGFRLTKNASLRLGYSHQEARFGRPSRRTTRVDNIDLGITYRKPLSLSRRTFLRFSTGSVVADQGGQRRLQAIGIASRWCVKSVGPGLRSANIVATSATLKDSTARSSLMPSARALAVWSHDVSSS